MKPMPDFIGRMRTAVRVLRRTSTVAAEIVRLALPVIATIAVTIRDLSRKSK